jgi:2-C-methyl-D-erythritol 4-phosphate cytidylyltransferase
VRVVAVVVAGGRGERFGGPKQFARVGGRTVASLAVAAARAVADSVVLVVPEGYGGDGEGADHVVVGGQTRSQSVRAGLALAGDADVVVVHDAARPLAGASLFHAVLDAVVAGADGAVPGLVITDTVKRVTRNGLTRVVDTVAREDLVTVQTPQAFRRAALMAAHASNPEATDDAALLEAAGAVVVVVPGETGNVKLTEPADLDRLVGTP